MHSKVESDKYVSVSYEADPPRRRDFVRVLLGRWRPTVRRVLRPTVAGMDRELKRTFGPQVRDALYDSSPFLGQFKDLEPGE